MEGPPFAAAGVEHAVDDDAMKVQVGIDRLAKAVDKGYRAEAHRGARTGAVRTQVLLHRAQEQAQSSTLEIGVALQENDAGA